MSVMNRPLFRANGGSVNGDRRRDIVDEINELDRLVADEIISQARADHDRQLLRDEMMQIPLSESEQKTIKDMAGSYFRDVGGKGRESMKDRGRGPRIRIEELADGGPANGFPDLSGDGRITQKDILMGRGVIAKQEGGPIMSQEAAGQVQMASEAEGQQVGLDYVAKTLGGIDQAEDVESMINAIRGNDMPIEARRTELAGFVGQDDAMATPESVLAMVQPTIMLSEEGAMNSGIGDLMQGMTSDIDMATEAGAPTDMGQGVGQLMMAGAPMDAAPQQFANGGAVQPVHMQQAGDPALVKKIQDLQLAGRTLFPSKSAEDLYAEYLPTFQNLIGKTTEDRDKDRALALAKAGFQFAAGRGPKGENIAGQPFLSQLGSVGGQFTEDIADISTQDRKTDTALRTLAAQAAFDQSAAQKKAQSEFVSDVFQETLKPKEPFVIGQTTTELGTVLNVYSEGDRDEKGDLVPISLGQALQSGLPMTQTSDTPTKPLTVSQIPSGKDPDQSRRILQPRLFAYSEGLMEAGALRKFENQIENAFPFESKDGDIVFDTPLQTNVIEAVVIRKLKGLPVNLRPELEEEALKQAVEIGAKNPSFLGGAFATEEVLDPASRASQLLPKEPDLDALAAEIPGLIADIDVSKTVGTQNAIFGKVGGVVDMAIETLTGTDPGLSADYQAGLTALSTLAKTNLILLLETQPGKENVNLQTQMQSLLNDIETTPLAPTGTQIRRYEANQRFNAQVVGLLEQQLEIGDLSAVEQKQIRNSLLKLKGISNDLGKVLTRLNVATGQPQTSGRLLTTPDGSIDLMQFMPQEEKPQ